MGSAPVQQRSSFPFPWGLLVVLGVYCVALVGYVYTQYWSSPEYVAAQKYTQARQLLGLDECAKCSESELNEAMVLVLEASRLVPDEQWFPLQIERLRWQFERKKFKLSVDLARKAELVSLQARRAAEKKQPYLVIGAKDKGWAPEQILAGPQRALLWGVPGLVLIIAWWAYLRFAAHRVRQKDREGELKKAEANLQELGQFRDGLDALAKKQAPLKSARLKEPDTDPDSTDPRGR